MENDNSEARSIIDSLGYLVGEGEIEARKIMGDTQYEETLGLIRMNNALSISQAAVHIELVKASCFVRSTLGVAILTSSALAVAWSFVLWFR